MAGGSAGEDVEPVSQTGAFPPAERAVLHAAARALAASDTGLDEACLRQVRDGLVRVVPFDRIALHVEDEGEEGSTFRVLWRDDVVAFGISDPYDTGIHSFERAVEAAVAPESEGARVNLDVDPNGTPVERALYQSSVRSFVSFPLVHRGQKVGWMTLSHYAPGAPSRAILPMLLALGHILGPGLFRAIANARGRLLATLVEESPDGMLALDRTGRILEFNRAAQRLLQRTRVELVGSLLSDLLGARAGDALTAPWPKSAKSLNVPGSGGRLDVEVVIARVNAAGDAAFQVHLREVLPLESEKRQLVDNLPLIVGRLDPRTGATLFVNRAIERVLGYPAEEIVGQPGMDGLFADPIEWEASAVARDAAARGRESGWQDRRYRHKDGRVLTLRESVYPVRDPAGAVRAIEVLAYDVSTEIESRKRLMQADRLASLGALAGGLAHEINNPIAFIALAAGQVLKLLEPTTRFEGEDRLRATQLLCEVSEAAARVSSIVGELKLFTRIPEGAHSTPVDMNRIVQMAVTLTSAELRRKARVEMNLGELPLVPGEYANLGQAIVNLLLNAAQAVDATRDGSPHFIRVSTFVAERAIVIRVSDTGVGIEPRLLPRIFDPFFKTKDAGEGAGLGLAIAHNLARRVGGDVRVSSEPGEGSTFEVVLPLDPVPEGPARAGAGAVARVVTPPVRSRGRVLIVDDEQSLANALARQLAARWDVDTVSTARDALAELAVHTYACIACDLRLPDQSGAAIYDAIRARSPKQAARFVFTTGGSFGVTGDEIHERAEATGRPILEKPFDGATFEALVSKVAAQED
jgi:PAS domain S-box-containing protein